MQIRKSALIAPALLALCATQAHAQLVIVPTYAANITSDPNAAAIEAGIQSAISVYETKFTNNNTVSILFQEGGGLGQSSTYINTVNYNAYAAALKNNEQGQGFLVSVTGDTTNPNTPNPVNGSKQVTTTLADLRTLGFASGNLAQYGLSYDSTITLNTAIMNLSRSGTQDSSKYDLQAVASHEIDEVLGLGSALDNLNNGGPMPTGAIGSLDLFRYSGDGVRSFDTHQNIASYLSADGGKNYIVYFNQTAGGDFHDFYSNNATPGAVRGPAQVQDAFGSPGTQENLGNSEFTALQMVGYNLLAPAPEPSQLAALGLGALGLAAITLRARRRNTSA